MDTCIGRTQWNSHTIDKGHCLRYIQNLTYTMDTMEFTSKGHCLWSQRLVLRTYNTEREGGRDQGHVVTSKEWTTSLKMTKNLVLMCPLFRGFAVVLTGRCSQGRQLHTTAECPRTGVLYPAPGLSQSTTHYSNETATHVTPLLHTHTHSHTHTHTHTHSWLYLWV